MISIVNNIKILCLDIIEKANSGHPGMPLGVSHCLFILFTKILNINPEIPDHYQRDRFILSNGHGCVIIYVLLYFLGYNYKIEDLKNFRQIDSITPGHPEYNPKLGIDATTGPLGQGIANGVGQAIASKKQGLNNKIIVMCGDGCLMEGISYEATSIAGHLVLNNLILIYDDNKITIDGETNLTFSDNIDLRFKSVNWDVRLIEDGNTDLNLIENTFNELYNKQEKPTIIILKTKIAHDTLLEGKSKSHGSPLGKENINKLKERYGYDINVNFEIKEETIEYFEKVKKEKKEKFNKKIINDYKLPEFNIEEIINNTSNIELEKDSYATRDLSLMYLKKLVNETRNLIIGSADLGSSNKTLIQNENITKDDFSKVYLNYGVREHAMVAIANGISTYGILPIVSTFLVFLSYCYGALRISALSKHKVLFIFTHDSIHVGEDGPTHQPIESLSLLRNLENVYVFRPADKNELIGCYHEALKYDGPSCMILSRQSLPMYNFTSIENVKYGGYKVYQSEQKTECIILATGSEVSLGIEVAKYFKIISVISIPCFEIFNKQKEKYLKKILSNNKEIFVIGLEASTYDFSDLSDCNYGIYNFGASGKPNDVLKKINFTKENIIEMIKEDMSFVD